MWPGTIMGSWPYKMKEQFFLKTHKRYCFRWRKDKQTVVFVGPSFFSLSENKKLPKWLLSTGSCCHYLLVLNSGEVWACIYCSHIRAKITLWCSWQNTEIKWRISIIASLGKKSINMCHKFLVFTITVDLFSGPLWVMPSEGALNVKIGDL